jgi:hypothetical protein
MYDCPLLWPWADTLFLIAAIADFLDAVGKITGVCNGFD